MVSPRNIMAAGLKSLLHFELIFLYGVKYGSNFILLHTDIQFSHYHILKRLSLSHFIFLVPLVKDQLTMYSQFLTLLPSSLPPPHSFFSKGHIFCISLTHTSISLSYESTFESTVLQRKKEKVSLNKRVYKNINLLMASKLQCVVSDLIIPSAF